MGTRHSLICGLVLNSLLSFGALFAAEPKWESLLSKVDPAENAVAGEWQKSDDALSVSKTQGARIALPVSPSGEYDLRASFTRKTGRDSVGLIVLHGGKQVVFEVDAWGMHLGGFQNVDGRSIQHNPTRAENVHLENNKRYTLTVEVRRNQLRGLLDGKEIATLDTAGKSITLPELWALPKADQLGLVAWDCDTTFHSLELRTLSAAAVAASTPPQKSVAKAASKDSKSANKSAASSTTKSGSKSDKVATITPPAKSDKRADKKRVLIVIANHHFFYREYGDPRRECEQAGFDVTVAAGRKATCRPHENSGQGADGGAVEADIALSDVKAKDYDVVLFSGGWGASAYQFAFNGRYNDSNYNGERAIKTEANRIVNEFVSQDKYVCGLCNGVSVLAWSRVNGRSPLAGKRVCAPVLQAPPGVYNGRPGQPSTRWHPEQNGARMSPPGVIGQPGTPNDDVLVDGKIITGEDDHSAQEMGRRIVEVLSKSP